MKKGSEIIMLTDDNDTPEKLMLSDMTPEEIDKEYERIFGKKEE